MTESKALTIKELPPDVKATAKAAPLVFCSFYTTKYRGDAVGLMKSLSALGLPYVVLNRTFPGSTWLTRATSKLRFTADVMKQLENRSVCWLDCDAAMCARPELLLSIAKEGYYEIAFRRTQGGRMRLGLLWFLNTDRIRDLLNRAADWLDANPARNESDAIERELVADTTIRVLPLPPEYEVIPGVTHLENPMHDHPVFLHRLKHSIGDRP